VTIPKSKNRKKKKKKMPSGEPHLAEGAAGDTGYVHATVLPARVPSSKHFSPLATVRLLWLFSTVGDGCISLVSEVEPRPLYKATALVGPLPREKQSF
jgi:hypothetical protein